MQPGGDPVKTPSGLPLGKAGRQRWHAHRQARRGQLVEAAVRAIRTRGASVGMDEIAAEAGVSKPILYRLFTDKADLYVAVGSFLAGELLGRIQPALVDVEESRDQVAKGVDLFLAAIEEDPELYRFVVNRQFLLHFDRGDRPPQTDPVADFTSLVGNALARIIGDHARAHGLDPGAAQPWGHGLVGLVQSAGDWWVRHGRPISRSALTSYLTTLIWDGIHGVLTAAQAAPAGPPSAAGSASRATPSSSR